MTKPSILITGVGGGVGQSIIKCLQNSHFRLIGVDGEPLGTGLYAVDKAYIVPYARDPEYIPRLLQICQDEDCQLIFPGLDAELIPLAEHASEFTAIGVTPVVSTPRVVEISDNKYATYKFLRDGGFPAPKTCMVTEEILEEFTFPMVLKPLKGGARSKGVYVIQDEHDLKFRLSRIDLDNYIAQDFIPGEEYTCGSINFAAHCFGVIIMNRVLRDGDTYKAFVQNDPQLTAHVKKAAEALSPFGPCNFQLRVKDGTPYIFEINARCSGTSASRAMVGFNEPLMTAEYLISGKQPAFEIRSGTILRYWKELYVDSERIGEVEGEGRLIGNGSKL